MLVVVTLGAFERDTEPDRRRGIDAIEDLVDASFLLVGAGFDIGRRATMKTGRDQGGDLLLREFGLWGFVDQ